MSGITVLVVTELEARHLAGLVSQFLELVESSDASDPAVERLTPDPYPDDRESARQFRDAAHDELLERRAADARRVLADLGAHFDPAGASDEQTVDIALDQDGVRVWMRTLAAIRLVLASRLGIVSEDDHDDSDPRFAVYDWLAYRLEGLIHASGGGQGTSNR